MSEIVFLNGSLLPLSQAMISVLDYGFLYGYGLFETMRAYQGRVFLLDSHLSRLTAASETLGFSVANIDLKTAVADVLQANRLGNARIRIAISIGEGGMIPDPSTCDKATVVILATEYHPYSEKIYRAGFKAIMSSIHRNSQSPLSRLKSANYLESLLAKQHARSAAVDEAILLNEKGHLAEASMSNIFLVTDSTLLTPAEDSGILSGITRAAILELCGQLSIKCHEGIMTLEKLFSAEEAFLTNSLMEIMPLTEIDGKAIGPGRPGPITEKLMAAYKRLVRQTIEGIP